MIKFIRRNGVLPVAVAAALLFLRYPQAAARGFGDGVTLCLRSVLPALFPFFVVSSLIQANRAGRFLAAPLFPVARLSGLRAPDAPLILLLSWLGGYAVCARLTGNALRAGRCSRAEARRLLMLGCCSGPGFVIGCVGGLMLGSTRVGVLLYGLQLAANFAAAALLSLLPLRRDGNGGETAEAELSLVSACETVRLTLPDAISGAVDSSLAVCGCVLFFRVLSAVVEQICAPGPVLTAWLRAGMEITAGCDAFAALGGRSALWGIGVCLSGLGFSVFAQIRQLTSGAVPMGDFFLSRLVHLGVLQGMIRLCSLALPGELAVFRSMQERVIVTSRLPPDCAILLLCFVGAVLYKTGRKFYNTL